MMVLVITGGDGGVHNVHPSHLLLPENRNHLKGSISVFPPVSSFNPDYSFVLISKPLNLITLLLPFLVPLPPSLYPFIHPLCCFHSVSPFPVFHSSSLHLPSSIVHSQVFLHLISLISLSPFPFSFSLSLICPGVFCSIYHLDDTLLLYINTLCRSVHTHAPACLQSFLLTCIQPSLPGYAQQLGCIL